MLEGNLKQVLDELKEEGEKYQKANGELKCIKEKAKELLLQVDRIAHPKSTKPKNNNKSSKLLPIKKKNQSIRRRSGISSKL